MEYKIFYSWQSDSPRECNRDFIRGALDDAVRAISGDGTVEDSPRADSGMEGVSGSPEVASIMFRKIEQSAIFVGDVSLVGSIPASGSREEKRVPNPNVLLEMGYAAGRLGWERIICVMNEFSGRRTDQPFDVRNRRFPINYTLDPADLARSASIKRDLAGWLRGAIEAAAESEHAGVEDAIGRLDANALRLVARFGKFQSFSFPESTTMGQVVAIQPSEIGVVRLLDLCVIKTDVNSTRGMYGYHWTYFGKLVLARLGVKDPASRAG